MLVGLVISVMIAIVVGFVLVPTIVSSVSEVKNDSEVPSGVGGIMDILVYVFIAAIILGSIAWMGAQASEGSTSQKTGRWVRDKWDDSVVTKPGDVITIKEGLADGDAVREIPIIEVEVTPRGKLGKDEVGWGGE